MAPISSKHELIQEWIPILLSRIPEDTLHRYKMCTCVNQDLSYKLPQLLSAATNDVPHDEAIDRAQVIIDRCLLIRSGLNIDRILDDSYFPEELRDMLERHSCLSVIGDDFKGNTVIYFDLANFNSTAYGKCWELGHRETPAVFSGYEDLMEPCVSNLCCLWYVRMMEWIHVHRFDSYKKGEVEEPRVVMILNVGSVGINKWSPELRQFLRGLKILGNYLFPEICDYIFAANVPWIADKFWSIVKMCLHPATASKVGLYDKKRTVIHLKTLIDQSGLPHAFGGEYEPERRFVAPSTKTIIPNDTKSPEKDPINGG